MLPGHKPVQGLEQLVASQAAREQDLRARFDYALWMDSDNHLVADCCEDLLGTLVALRHGWAYTAGTGSGRFRAAHVARMWCRREW